MILIGVLPSALIVRRQPEDMGLTIDGITAAPPSDCVLGLNEDNPTGGESDQTWTLRQVMRTQTFWLILVSLFVISIANAGVVLHLIPHLTEQGLSEGSAVGAISVFSTSAAAATLLLGILTERVSPRLMMLFGYMLAALAMFVLIIADTIFEVYLFAVIQGAAAGGINVLAPILLASYYGRRVLGSIYGIVRSAQVVGFATGTLLSGIVYDATGSYRNAFESFLIIAVVSSTMMLLARRPKPAVAHPV
jgi:MFS family permease